MIMCGFWFSWRVEAVQDWPSTEKERGKHRKTREGRGKAKEKERRTEKGSFWSIIRTSSTGWPLFSLSSAWYG